MRVATLLAAGAVMLALGAWAPASAGGGRNPDGYGIYSPDEPPVRNRPRLYRYDPRSWYYSERGYYFPNGSGYWASRAEMRYRYRYRYVGPTYRYQPAWGYDGCLRKGHCD